MHRTVALFFQRESQIFVPPDAISPRFSLVCVNEEVLEIMLFTGKILMCKIAPKSLQLAIFTLVKRLRCVACAVAELVADHITRFLSSTINADSIFDDGEEKTEHDCAPLIAFDWQ